MTSAAIQETIDRQFDQVLSRRELHTVFQPVVHLATGDVVGYEALFRGPEGSPLATADALVSAAERTGRLVELDWAARANACREALDAGLDMDNILFLNFEPVALNTDCPDDLWPDIEQGFRTFRVVLEVTERSLDRDPATLLEGVERQRTQIAGIGLDDVGSVSATVAMLPLISPDVIKIDRSVIQAAPDAQVARVFNAVHQEVERTGAVVLAEGIETPEHLHYSLAQGAQLGQGIMLGQPAPLPGTAARVPQRAVLRRAAPTFVVSPFDALGGQVDGAGDDELIRALINDLAAFAEASMPSLYVSLLPVGRTLADEDLPRLSRLVARGAFVAVLGPGVPTEPGHGLRGRGGRNDPLPDDQWAAIAIGPGLSAAVLARRRPDSGEWLYGVVHEHTRVASAARSLVRLLGTPEPSRAL